ncbi:MAG: hypothetical protein Q8N12_09000 [Thermodesulfovibrionales bacterium]|nr:hypothetical protein [bacterium]MDP3049543.1 hypothetical protein [Thermodesulfovibrionales bacterium]
MSKNKIKSHKDVENIFHRAMIGVYESALRECRYNATRFIQMVQNHGGVESAKILLHTPGFQYGFTELWQCGCLRLTMEALVIQPQYAALFTQEEIEITRTRLEECGYFSNNES